MYFNQVIVSSNEQIEYFSSQNDKKNLPINKTDAADRQAPDSHRLCS